MDRGGLFLACSDRWFRPNLNTMGRGAFCGACGDRWFRQNLNTMGGGGSRPRSRQQRETRNPGHPTPATHQWTPGAPSHGICPQSPGVPLPPVPKPTGHRGSPAAVQSKPQLGLGLGWGWLGFGFGVGLGWLGWGWGGRTKTKK